MPDLRSGAAVAASGALGALGGGAVGGTTAVAIGAGIGVLLGGVTAAAGVRPVVVTSVATGAAVGFVLGRGIVRLLCAPAGCPAVEWTAAVVTSIGAFVGVGLVVALAVRSFEEYRQASDARRPPREGGGGPDDDPGHQ